MAHETALYEPWKTDRSDPGGRHGGDLQGIENSLDYLAGLDHEGKFVATKHFRVAVQDLYAAKADSENFTTGWFVKDMPRIPQPYYGTEILMTSTRHRDDNAARQNFPGGWTGDKINGIAGAGLPEKIDELAQRP